LRNDLIFCENYDFGSVFNLVLFTRDCGTLCQIPDLPVTLIKYDLTPPKYPSPKPRTRSANECVASFRRRLLQTLRLSCVNLLRRARTRPQIISTEMMMIMIMIRMRSAAAAATHASTQTSCTLTATLTL